MDAWHATTYTSVNKTSSQLLGIVHKLRPKPNQLISCINVNHCHPGQVVWLICLPQHGQVCRNRCDQLLANAQNNMLWRSHICKPAQAEHWSQSISLRINPSKTSSHSLSNPLFVCCYISLHMATCGYMSVCSQYCPIMPRLLSLLPSHALELKFGHTAWSAVALSLNRVVRPTLSSTGWSSSKWCCGRLSPSFWQTCQACPWGS